MVELLFVACLSTAPETCQERSMLYQDISPMTCMMGAQPALAEWVEGHPNWTIAQWRCRSVDLSERDA